MVQSSFQPSSGHPPDDTIRFDAVSLARGGRSLFAGLNLTLDEHRIGLIGANGSGKSSLLRLINGLLLPDAGKVRIGGRDTVRDRDELPGRIGFVFQNPDHQIIFPTVGEEVAFGLTLRGLTKGEAAEQARALLAAHGCAGWEDRAVQELSEGQKQLVCILAVIAPQPGALLLDECFASLDLRARADLMARLMALPQRLIMASHDLDLLASFDRVIWLDGGRVCGDGAPAEIIAAYRAAMTNGGGAP
ncbi:MAG: energy-coupling factor ABC transporter ATP-binding protein [Xanthobacteraceae bacterium]|nr:MAG: energy-coupling factor ABC transporter ATP-binding protein [Xanthobacteraceae bacterium]